ncbi:MAG: transporter substrate-binding domain-containing protein [Oscillospiraceae bacterium]|nr:transporter substrate-binding domain-containing protein [Oscillospiraceae bacterium]
MNSRSKKAWLSIVLAGLLALSAACPAFAADGGDARVVRAAVYNNSNLAYQDADGVWRGSDIECLINIAQRAGFSVEFVDSANDPDFLDNLDNGTYDIVCDVVRTPERDAQYAFSDMALGTMNNILTVRADDSRWDYGDIGQISSMRIGILRTYANNGEFRNWCVRRGVTPQITEYEGIDGLTAGLKSGEVDGILYSMMYGTDYAKNFRTILQLLPEAYCFAFRKDDTALKNAVDEALAQIIIEDPDYLTNLNDRYTKQFGQSMLPLSQEEIDYIAQHPTISVAVLENDEPYFSRGKNGAARGIIPDYYALLSGYSGLQFVYTVYPTQAAAAAAVRSGEADVLGIFSGGIIAAHQNSLALTEKIMTVSNFLVTKSGTDMADVSVVAVKNRAMVALENMGTGALLSGAQLQGYESARDCFKALRDGDADGAVLGMPSATWLLNQTNSSLYSLTSLPGITLDHCSAVREDDRTLCSILNKSIAATRENVDGIVSSDTLPENSLVNYLNRVPSFTVALIAAALLLLVVGLVWTLILLKRRQDEHAAMLAGQAETERKRLQVEAMQKSAEEQNRFFSNISHDMRTPLNAVLGFIRLARKDGLPERQRREYLVKAESSGALMLDLINDTLTMSKASSGKLDLHLEPVDTQAVGESITTPIHTLAAQKNITFVLDKSGYRPRTVLADRLALQKIFLNILNNAVKYTPAGGHVWATVYDDPKDSPSPDLVFVIRDDGIGISADFLPHLFEPFRQERRRGYEYVGTGLGLSIVKKLVDRMGGTIGVESEKDKGTCFTVRLHLPEVEKGADRQDGPAPAAGDIAGMRVLLCEDNELNRQIAVALLKDRGVEVDVAADGRAGLEIFSGSPDGCYGAILMDIRMPVMDGIEATKAIRALGRDDAKTVPIIAMTADAFADDVQRCLDAGMNAHLAKPIEPQALYLALSQAAAPPQ